MNSSSRLKTGKKSPMILSKVSSGGGFENSHPLGQDTVNAIVDQVCTQQKGTNPFSEHGQGFVAVASNPCGEHHSGIDARIPDGAITQSGLIRVTLFETIVPPWASLSSVPATSTNNWGLFGWSPPAYRTACVMICSRTNQAPTPDQELTIFNRFNTTKVPDYPAWVSVTENPETSEYFISRLVYKSADLRLTGGLSQDIQSFRICSEGQVWHHNTPTLWDQGSFAIGQFSTDQVNKNSDQVTSTATITIDHESRIGAQVAYKATITYPGNVNNGILMAEVTKPLASASVIGQLTAQANKTYTLTNVPPFVGTFAPSVVAGAPINVTFSQIDPVTGRITVTAFGGTPVTIFIPQDKGQVTQDLNIFGQILQGETINNNFYEVSPPSFQQSDIAQVDPKFAGELMKEHNGFYTVRRPFEPVLNMNEVIETGVVFVKKPGMERIAGSDTTGGLRDEAIDVNFGTITFAIRGISYAANPVVKCVKYMEVLTTNANLAIIMEDAPAEDQDAVATWRQISALGPHSYIPDANSLGLLATFVMNVVQNIPQYLKVAKSISNAVATSIGHVETFFGW